MPTEHNELYAELSAGVQQERLAQFGLLDAYNDAIGKLKLWGFRQNRITFEVYVDEAREEVAKWWQQANRTHPTLEDNVYLVFKVHLKNGQSLEFLAYKNEGLHWEGEPITAIEELYGELFPNLPALAVPLGTDDGQ